MATTQKPKINKTMIPRKFYEAEEGGGGVAKIPDDVLQKMYAERDRLFPFQTKWQHDEYVLLTNKNADNYELNCLYQQSKSETEQRRTDFFDGLRSGYSLSQQQITSLQDKLEAAKLALKEIAKGTFMPQSIAQNALRLLNSDMKTNGASQHQPNSSTDDDKQNK